jgi:hypothetical protein
MEKERAVSIGDIAHAVQNQLDAEAPATEDGMPQMSAGFVLDVYIDDQSTFALITKDDGKLYKVPVTVGADNNVTIGEYEQVAMEFTPVAAARQVQIKRSADGSVRWFAMPACTAVLNRDGEIDSRALFDGFVEYAERTGNYPQLDFFHLGEHLILGQADWVARDGATYCASGLFDDTPIARAAIKSLEANDGYWGLSIAYIATKGPEIIRSKEGIEIHVFNDGINRFISLLPENTAASILTSITTLEGVNRMNEKVKAALKKLTGDDEELLNELALKLDTVNRNAEGMINREAVPEEVPAETPAVEVRAMSADDIQMLLGSPDFENKVTEIVTKLIEGQNQNAKEDKPAEAAAAAAADEQRESSLLKALEALTAKVDELSQSREAQIAEVLNDLPAKVTREKIVRPRATIMPSALNSKGISMAEIAAETLEKMKQN